jgi:TolA-binding protein
MKKYRLFVSCTLTLLMVSCVSNKINEADPVVSPADRPAPPLPQPQDGSFIVRPEGTSKVKLSKTVQLQASAAAEREVIRRQQATKDADTEVQNAIQDLKEGSLNDARLKLRKAVQKYPKTGT